MAFPSPLALFFPEAQPQEESWGGRLGKAKPFRKVGRQSRERRELTGPGVIWLSFWWAITTH